MNIATNLFWNVVAKTPDEPLSVPNTWEGAAKPRVNPWEGEPDKKEYPAENDVPVKGENPVEEEPASDAAPVKETGETNDSYEEAKPSGVPLPLKPRIVSSRILLADTDKPKEEKPYESEVLYKAANDVFVMHFDDATATSDALQMVADALAEAELDPAKMHSYVVGYNGNPPLDDKYIENTQPQKSKSAENEPTKSESAGDEPVEQAEEESQEPGFKFKAVHGYSFDGEEEKAYPAQSIFMTARPFKGGTDSETDLWFSERLDDLVESSTQYLCEVSPETPFDDLTKQVDLWVERSSLVGDNSILEDISHEVSEDGKTLSVTIVPNDYAHISDLLSSIDIIGMATESVPCSVGGIVEIAITVPTWKDGAPYLAELKEALDSAFGKKGSKVNVSFVKDENLHIRVYLGVATVEKGALKGAVYAPPRLLEAWEAIDDQFQGDYEELAGKILASGKKLEDYKPVAFYERSYGSGNMPEQNAAQEFIYRLSLSVKQINAMRLHKAVQAIVTGLAATKPELFEAPLQEGKALTYLQDLANAVGRVGSVNFESGGKLAEAIPEMFTPERLASIKTTDDIDGYAQMILQDVNAADPDLVENRFPLLITALKRLEGGPAAALEQLTLTKPDLIPQTLPALVKAETLGDNVITILKEWILANPNELSVIMPDLNAIATKDTRIATMLRQVAVKNPALLPDILPVLVLTKEIGDDIVTALEQLLTSDPDVFDRVKHSIADAMKINKGIRNMVGRLGLEITVNAGRAKRRAMQVPSADVVKVKDNGRGGEPLNYTPLKDKIIPYIVHSKQARDGVAPTNDGIPEIKRPYFTVMMVPKDLAFPEGETFKTFQDVIDARDESKGSTPAQKKEADDMLYQLYLRLRNEEMWNEVVSEKVDI